MQILKENVNTQEIEGEDGHTAARGITAHVPVCQRKLYSVNQYRSRDAQA
jgi:hypothetical protein